MSISLRSNPDTSADILLNGSSVLTLNVDGSVSTTTQASGNNTTKLATTAFVQGLLISPALTGTPTAPTASINTNTTQIASTAFVLAQASTTTPNPDGIASYGSSTKFAREDHIHASNTQVNTSIAVFNYQNFGGF